MNAPSWGLGRRIAFRFGFLFAAVFMFPFPIGTLPKTGWLAELLTKPLDWGVPWFARSVLGLSDLADDLNGSGDRTYDYVQLLLYAVIAALGTLAWSILDRRRPSYARLARWTWVVLRYALAYAMLSYGFAKILKSQFPDLPPGRLAETVGDMSPMGLLWTFMGYSTPYTVFAGLVEAIAGALLLWRRTTMLGALLAAAVMFNIVLLNFCYDVPVKLYSMQLFAMAAVIALPRARAVLAAALGRAAAEEPPRTRMSPRREHARLLAKLVLIGTFAWNVYSEFSGQPSRNAHVHELYGGWLVDSLAIEGEDPAALQSAPERWYTLGFNGRSLWILPLTGDREGLTLKVDAEHHTTTVDLDDRLKDKDRKKDKDGKSEQEVWTYERPSPDHLVIDGVHRGKKVHATLHLVPEPLLITRGFHWINEVPFNR